MMPLTLRNKKELVYDPTRQGKPGRLKRDDVNEPKTPSNATRVKRQQLKERAERRKITKANVPAAPPSPNLELMVPSETVANGSKPTCLAFGITEEERKVRYPDYFF
jgi:hypothetical protein